MITLLRFDHDKKRIESGCTKPVKMCQILYHLTFCWFSSVDTTSGNRDGESEVICALILTLSHCKVMDTSIIYKQRHLTMETTF